MSAALAGLVALLLAFPWYVVWGGQYLRTQRLFLRHMDTPFALRLDWGLTISNMVSNHLWETLSAYLFEPVAWVFGAALLYFLLEYRRHRALLISWILVPYILLNILGLYEEDHLMRYMGSVLPAVALIMATSLQGLMQRVSELFWRGSRGTLLRSAIFLLLLIETSLYLSIIYLGNGNLIDPFGEMLSGRDLVLRSNQYGITSPSKLGWDMEEIGDLLEKEWAGRPTPPRVFYLNEIGLISEGITIEMGIRRLNGGVDFIETRCWEHVYGYFGHDESYPGCESVFNSSDYVILEEIRRDEFWVRRDAYDTEIASFALYIEDHLEEFTLLRMLSLNSRPEELPAPDSPAFSWLNGSAWILRRNG